MDSVPKQVIDLCFDLRAKEFRESIFALAAEMNVDRTVAIAGMAEVAGIAAAQLDREEDRELFTDRMHSFFERAETIYKRMRASE